ncbi:receptor-like kinase LIP2 [Humulus lupulus]|uniref:receptor-like kinase LIP2 n=1 Tax=Humulus lupulus TaxID=3486 RepID=UPI002B40A900|nr:receptor-like kinase LIP2 [Humulus lupulus]
MNGCNGFISLKYQGYLDPQYVLTHKLTEKSDVYNLGIVFLELLTGMRPIFHNRNIVSEVLLACQVGRMFSIMDRNMGSYMIESIKRFMDLALKCCQEETNARPSMLEIVRELENICSLQCESDSSTLELKSTYVEMENFGSTSLDVRNNTSVLSNFLDMAFANFFDLYSTQEEEEVPLVRRRKSARKHDRESSQVPPAKKNRATDPPKDGPSGQPSAQNSAPAEKEIPPPHAATNPSPTAPNEQAQQADLPGAKLASRSLWSAKDRLTHILKHDCCREAMAEGETMGVNQILNRALNEVASAMLTMTAARARASARIDQSRVKLTEELQAAEARHAGELEVMTQQKDSLAAELAEKQASLENVRKQRDDYQDAS